MVAAFKLTPAELELFRMLSAELRAAQGIAQARVSAILVSHGLPPESQGNFASLPDGEVEWTPTFEENANLPS